MVNRFVVNIAVNLTPLPTHEQLERINEGIKARNLKKSDIISITHDFPVAFVYYWDETTEQKS